MRAERKEATEKANGRINGTPKTPKPAAWRGLLGETADPFL